MRRNNTLQTIHEIHRSYDTLQYPFQFWNGYQVNIQQRNSSTDTTNIYIIYMKNYTVKLIVKYPNHYFWLQ